MKKYEIQVIRSNRKSISLEIRPDLTILLRAPKRMPKREMERFVEERQEWIDTHLEKMRLRQDAKANNPKAAPFSREEMQKLADQAVITIPQRVEKYAPLVGVTYGRITIRNQKTRWGSCSAKGNLNFNCLLMLTPPEVMDYVVVHELCHRLEMNHSVKFWAEVARVYPNYKMAKAWLKENGGTLIERIRG